MMIILISSSLSLLKSDQSEATEATETAEAAEATETAGDTGDSNNNAPESLQSPGQTGASIETLSASAAVSVGEFYRKLQGSQGRVLGKLLRGEICLRGDGTDVDFPLVLEELSQVFWLT